MNEAETRAELIDPILSNAGWIINSEIKIFREYKITNTRVGESENKSKSLKADYILSYKNVKLAVIEAKSNETLVGEGVAQAKMYAQKLMLDYAYSTNGKEIYQVCMKTGKEGLVDNFPSPEELYNKIYEKENKLKTIFNNIPFEDNGGLRVPRFYQEIAINSVLDAVTQNKKRMLLTLATGTGKTQIAFQIAWKLFYARWNLRNDFSRRPRILFLADRNNLASQAFNDFSAFKDDILIRITADEIAKKGKVPTNGNIFFTIFQTFMSGKDKNGNPAPYFGEYPNDYFDFIIIDECHRGGANDESTWRGIMEYFSPAFQLGLTATPKRDENANTYSYFGEPLYTYSLKDGINDGFLTPFKVKKIQTTIDTYIYTSDDTVIEGEVEQGREYKESDFNKIIEIKEREEKRVKIILHEINQNEKTIVFCATQEHALVIRDLINEHKISNSVDYCHRVTADDGKMGDQYLNNFQNNDNTIPTILTTSQKLSTGVNAPNIRNIVLLRPINSIIEFKQIIGRGTRLFENKKYFTIYDFVGAYKHFLDPEWDGDALSIEEYNDCEIDIEIEKIEKLKDESNEKLDFEDNEENGMDKKIKIKLSDGKEREIKYMLSTSFWDVSGKPISSNEFLDSLYGKLPEFFKNEEELINIWSIPRTRKKLLSNLEEVGFGKEELKNIQSLVSAEKSDIFDVLEYVAFALKPIERNKRAQTVRYTLFDTMNEKQKEFIDFVLSNYSENGIYELEEEKLPTLLELKYHSLAEALRVLGEAKDITNIFTGFQRSLYAEKIAESLAN